MALVMDLVPPTNKNKGKHLYVILFLCYLQSVANSKLIYSLHDQLNLEPRAFCFNYSPLTPIDNADRRYVNQQSILQRSLRHSSQRHLSSLSDKSVHSRTLNSFLIHDRFFSPSLRDMAHSVLLSRIASTLD